MPQAQDLMTIREVASELRISPRTVRALVNERRLPAIKVAGEKHLHLRFRRADVDAWISEQLVGCR